MDLPHLKTKNAKTYLPVISKDTIFRIFVYPEFISGSMLAPRAGLEPATNRLQFLPLLS